MAAETYGKTADAYKRNVAALARIRELEELCHRAAEALETYAPQEPATSVCNSIRASVGDRRSSI